MKFYYALGSSSLSVRIALGEAGLRFTPIKVDERSKIMEGGGDYRSVNPLGFAPSLVLEDESLITESAAILQYIADLVPEMRLAPPAGTLARTRLHTWLNFLSSELHKGGFGPLFYAGIPDAGRDVFRKRLQTRFAHVDNHLRGQPYLLGNDYSVADCHLFVISSWSNWVRFDLARFPNVLAYRQRVAARPAVQIALMAEGLVPWPANAPH